jgi:hypothetical protein
MPTAAPRAGHGTAAGGYPDHVRRDESWRRAAARRFAVAAAIAAAGIVVIVASSGTGRIIGWGVLGVGLVVAISLVFLEIGYSEDRERARDAGRR